VIEPRLNILQGLLYEVPKWRYCCIVDKRSRLQKQLFVTMKGLAEANAAAKIRCAKSMLEAGCS
jgi:hypothetical protein